MLQGLRPWVERESPTFDAAAVSGMVGLAAARLGELGAEVQRIAAPMPGIGDCALAKLPHPRQGEPGILILCHLDTVHPVGTLAKLPFRRDGTQCYGPGIVDMKGGTYAAVEALAQLQKAGLETPLPVSVLLTSDEEIGSPGTRDLILEHARRNNVVLVPEPARPDGGCVTGRYAIARFNVETHGRPSHAGAALKDGRSAIRMMAEQVVEIEAMTGDDCTFSVGVIHGGQWVNCVATTCRAEVLSMAKRQADLDAGVDRMLARNSTKGDGTGVVVKLGVVRPVWEPNGACMALYRTAESVAHVLGMELPHYSAGGGSDGNFTGAAGIPTLDGLGVSGQGVHTLEERVEVSSLARSGRLMAGLMLALS
ncbi:MAG: M20/M25/M40 family metallo-hydrolase [Geminicoccaceae bacterium]|nr:MAG: M20/M25/M40 family metallo-hydrolase [Geminicoccaceae bacterium]